MARREYPTRFTCAGPGCRESTTYYCATRREQDDVRQMHKRTPWKCTRHANPDACLRPGNETTRQVLVATRALALPACAILDDPPRYLEGLYWYPEGRETGSGFEHGPGFVAHATDFPEGTRLVVTTQIEMPAATEDADA